MRHIITFFIILFGFSSAYALQGRVDVGPLIMDIDILESGKTIETLHMKGVKGDATLLVYEGLCIKPGFIWGQGHGELTSGTIAVGYYIPVTKKLKLLPNVGVTWSYLYTHIDLEDVGLFHLKERFRSSSPFIGMEICYTLTDKWSFMGIYQYAWCQTHTKITSIGSDKSHSCGPNYAIAVEYSLDAHWSMTAGAGYNITLSKEKHGLRGKGAKLGIAYYF